MALTGGAMDGPPPGMSQDEGPDPNKVPKMNRMIPHKNIRTRRREKPVSIMPLPVQPGRSPQPWAACAKSAAHLIPRNGGSIRGTIWEDSPMISMGFTTKN